MSAPTLPPVVPPAPPGAQVPPVPPTPPRPAATNPAAWGRHPLVRIPTLAVGGLLTLLLLAGTTFVVANVLVRTTETDSATLTGPIRRVDVQVTGSVTISTGAADRAEVDRRSTFGVTRPTVTQQLVDGLLTVRAECSGGISVMCHNDVDLVVPADVSLTIESLGVDIADVQGDVEIDSGAGSVHLRRLGGELDVSVGGGSIDGEDLRSTRLRVDAGAGSVTLELAVPPDDVEAVSGAGSVLVTVPAGREAYRVDADAGAGSDRVTVRTDPTSDRVIRANAGAGSVEVRYQP